MAEVGKSWNEFRWRAQDRSEYGSLSVPVFHKEQRARMDTHDVGGSLNQLDPQAASSEADHCVWIFMV